MEFALLYKSNAISSTCVLAVVVFSMSSSPVHDHDDAILSLDTTICHKQKEMAVEQIPKWDR